MQKKRMNNGRDNRQRSRNRRGGGGDGGGNYSGGGGNSDGVHPRQRKQAMAQRDKYSAKAKDALSQGDRVEAEYYFQHVEHYVRVLAAIDEMEGRNRPQPDDAGDKADADESEGNQQAQDASDEDSERPARRTRSRREEASADNDDSESSVKEIPLPSTLFNEEKEEAKRAAGAGA